MKANEIDELQLREQMNLSLEQKLDWLGEIQEIIDYLDNTRQTSFKSNVSHEDNHQDKKHINDFFSSKKLRYRKLCQNMTGEERLQSSAKLFRWNREMNPEAYQKDIQRRAKDSFVLKKE